ncbi:MAG: ATP-binding protein [Parvularculaceae bacterium]
MSSMQIKANALTLRCRKSEERIQFSPRLSFFHGEMAAGKSTIVEMINYCFGGKLVKTPAVSGEVVSVQLDLSIDNTELLIERSLDPRPPWTSRGNAEKSASYAHFL